MSKNWIYGWPVPLGFIKAFECRTCGRIQRGWLVNAGRRPNWRASHPHCSACHSVAHTAVAKAVKSGAIAPAKERTCADCGQQAHGYDHRNYTKPLAVEPVCRSCNWHRGPAERAFVHGSLQTPAKAAA